MVCIEVIRTGPSRGLHRLLSGQLGIGGASADQIVFPVGFIPNGGDGNALGGGLLQGSELGYALFSKAVAQSEGKSFKRHRKKAPRAGRRRLGRESTKWQDAFVRWRRGEGVRFVPVGNPGQPWLYADPALCR